MIVGMINDKCSKVTNNTKWVLLSGTSFSAPLVSGIAALWIQASAYKGTEKVRCALKSASIDVLQKGYDPVSGWGVPTAPEGFYKPCETGLPAPSLLALAALRRRKRLMIAVLIMIPMVLAVNELEVSLSWALAQGIVYFVQTGNPYVSAMIALVTFVIFWISIVLAKFVKKLIS